MKILFLIHNISYCGAERVFALIANELCKRNYDIYVITDPNEVNYSIDERIHVLDAYLYSKKYDVKNPLGKGLRLIKYHIGFAKVLKKYIREIHPDHIVSFLGFFIWQLLPYRRKYKITISDHSAMNRSINPIMDYERRKLAEKFFCQTVLSRADKDYLGKNRTNVIVMNNPLTFKPIQEKEFEEGFEQRHNILFCGSIDRYHIKGLDNLLRALSIVKKQTPNFKLDIAGHGNEKNINTIKSMAVELNVADNINFLGFCENVAEEMKNHSILVVPSRSEGFGMVIIEAMASGCPVISYALSGPQEIITNEIDGILVENQNIERLAEAIIRLNDLPEVRKQIGRKGLQSVERFSLETIVNKWEKLLTS